MTDAGREKAFSQLVFIHGIAPCAEDHCAFGCRKKKMKEAEERRPNGGGDDERGARASSLDIVVRRALREPVDADRCHTTAGCTGGDSKEFVSLRRHQLFREYTQ